MKKVIKNICKKLKNNQKIGSNIIYTDEDKLNYIIYSRDIDNETIIISRINNKDSVIYKGIKITPVFMSGRRKVTREIQKGNLNPNYKKTFDNFKLQSCLFRSNNISQLNLNNVTHVFNTHQSSRGIQTGNNCKEVIRYWNNII